jgi:hypothetical protein
MSCNTCDKIIEAASLEKSPCECPVAGWCKRHQTMKFPHFWEYCKNDIRFFLLWEHGRGPGQQAAALQRDRVIGLGDALAWLIRTVTFGYIVPCDQCTSRKAWLNRYQLWPIRWPGGKR